MGSQGKPSLRRLYLKWLRMKNEHGVMNSRSYAALDEDLPVLRKAPTVTRFYAVAGKRVFDIALLIVSLPITLPVIAVLAILVMCDGGKPFFGHQRVGKDGHSFKCWKIRSMVPNAEARLQDHLRDNREARDEWAANFKLTNDPRITKLGEFLRKSSLDELPQIWNILKGEMSFVGPRPVTLSELDLYGTARNYYQAVLPGLTGLWQVSGRNNLSYRERVMLDVRYAVTHNFLMDVRVILETAGAVINFTGR